MRRSTRVSLAALTAAAMLAACGESVSDDPNGVDQDDAPSVDAPEQDDSDPDTDGSGNADQGATEDPEENGQQENGVDEDPGNGDDLEIGGDFDWDEASQQAEDLLGTPEEDIEEDAETRIVRRGDEDFPGTMDLRPGRQNVELDEIDGSVVVTRISVEVPDGEDPIDVQLDT